MHRSLFSFTFLFTSLFVGAVLVNASSNLAHADDSTSLANEPINIAQVKAFVPVLSDNYAVERQFVGQVIAKQRADIGFELAGKISNIYVDEGERVEQGAILMQLDTELLEIEYIDLQAQLQQLAADASLVKANLKRVKSLNDDGYASAQNVDELVAQQKSLWANKARIDASIKANRTRIEKSTLVAPYSGIIDRRTVSEGAVVGASQPVLTVLQKGANEVKVGVPVRLLEQVDMVKPKSVTVAKRHYAVDLVAAGGQVDPVTRTVQLRFALPDNDNLVSGQLAYLNVVETVEEPGYWIPVTAITDGIRGLWNVYAIVAQSDGNFKLERRDVSVRYATEDQAFVRGALQAGEAIVATGMHRYVPGQTVNPSGALEEASQ
ncbi:MULTISPECIES: efflux RND transporter periplasmic adaptor subunit [unclassified Agarivorans]|uniref:efflux RND transporter periplasmic adaptor subunit n=1 Tax=unclassified Agarivorans TaxID=2636026 RepID=UPI0026E2068B|nr:MULTISPECIES: efflux RND transporter periplasmic adaptor subunit [unclassified Agarivorans]MDO6685392.1 efflux RND transporter periplasmic adaptor subunit [Agarivorans sp. 3_MG-2023]MDO6715778.1 efflux RND transporter periplasmic adaptor subunit [Agarivorans sp. 2_MG-2023]